ncbi:MAG: hypothetical protein ACREQ9_14780, partial [Candidatus Binatia bacterium]
WSETNAPASAAAHWRATRELAANVPDPDEGVRLRIAACVGLLRAADYESLEPAEIDSAFEEGRRLALESRDLDSRVRLLLARSALALADGDLDPSAALLAEAEEVAAASGDPELRFVVRGHAGFASVVRGEQLEALERYEEAFAILGDVRPRDNFVMRRYLGAATNRAMIVAETGRLRQAATELDQLTVLATAAGDLSYQCIAHFCRNRLAIYCGDSRAAVGHARDALEAAERMGLVGFRAGARLALGGAYLLGGNHADALAALEDAERTATADALAPSQRLTLLARLAEAHLGRGDEERALAISAEAAAGAGTTKRLGAADVFLARSRILLTADARKYAVEVARLLDSAATIVSRAAARVYEPAILEARARLARTSGDDAEAARHLREALALYVEMGASGHATRLAGELGEPQPLAPLAG